MHTHLPLPASPLRICVPLTYILVLFQSTEAFLKPKMPLPHLHSCILADNAKKQKMEWNVIT